MTISAVPRLLEIMQQLRATCPWDKAQTPESLTRYAIEEAYELEAAIREGDITHIKEELGDLLLQVVFQACLFEENAHFNFNDIASTLCDKLIRRHPHVFVENQSLQSIAQVSDAWQRIKQQEKAGQPQSLLRSVKPGSALQQSQQLQKVAARVGFDWPDVVGAQDKLAEELLELQTAIANENQLHIEDELGDCFFALINVARKLNVDSEKALLGTMHKFRTRFAFIEQHLAEQGKTPETSTLEEMDMLWNLAKANK